MIDHVLGRPSVRFRKIQVFAVVSFWSLYLAKGDRHGPPTFRKLSRRLSKLLTPWQTVVITLLYLYIARNAGKLLGLECPEPLANLYTRSYFRATWVTTAMDAGFWSAMRIRRKWIRDIASMVFTFYYLIAAEQADEKVRKVRATLTVDHLRVSWNKGTTPYLSFISKLLRPRLMRYPPRAIRIPRPTNSDYKEPVNGWLYFDGPLSALKNHNKVVLDIPGGGFVAMDPRTNDDKLFAWAGKTGLPVLSIDYRKAPEYPYPYALNEGFDVYQTLVASRGRCIGLSGDSVPKIVITGDSAGGNLATGIVMMIIEANSTSQFTLEEGTLPIPEGLILVYPGLDMNIGNWMSDEQMSLIKDRRMRKTNRAINRQKSMQYTHLANTPHQSEEDLQSPPNGEAKDNFSITLPSEGLSTSPVPEASTAPPSYPPKDSPTNTQQPRQRRPSSHHPEPLQTRLAMSSMISYFNDRILTPEMMRAMIILYIGPHNRPDFSTDYHLSPILAPNSILVHFPKTYILTGERDPLVDDTVIFAGRLRRAKAEKFRGLNDRDVVEVTLIPGISHGFLQFAGVFSEGWKYIYKCGGWIEEIFERSDRLGTLSIPPTPAAEFPLSFNLAGERHHRRQRTESSGDEGLEMSMSQISRGKVITPPGRARERKRKERLLREQVQERSRGLGNRKKSLVSLASTDDLLGRRMLGIAGPLTGRGDDGNGDR